MMKTLFLTSLAIIIALLFVDVTAHHQQKGKHGDDCGGKTGVTCKPGLTCEQESDSSDDCGTCVPDCCSHPRPIATSAFAGLCKDCNGPNSILCGYPFYCRDNPMRPPYGVCVPKNDSGPNDCDFGPKICASCRNTFECGNSRLRCMGRQCVPSKDTAGCVCYKGYRSAICDNSQGICCKSPLICSQTGTGLGMCVDGTPATTSAGLCEKCGPYDRLCDPAFNCTWDSSRPNQPGWCVPLIERRPNDCDFGHKICESCRNTFECNHRRLRCMGRQCVPSKDNAECICYKDYPSAFCDDKQGICCKYPLKCFKDGSGLGICVDGTPATTSAGLCEKCGPYDGLCDPAFNCTWNSSRPNYPGWCVPLIERRPNDCDFGRKICESCRNTFECGNSRLRCMGRQCVPSKDTAGCVCYKDYPSGSCDESQGICCEDPLRCYKNGPGLGICFSPREQRV